MLRTSSNVMKWPDWGQRPTMTNSRVADNRLAHHPPIWGSAIPRAESLRRRPERPFSAYIGGGPWTSELKPLRIGSGLVQEVASPSVPSWNQIAEFLGTMQRLRDSGTWAA